MVTGETPSYQGEYVALYDIPGGELLVKVTNAGLDVWAAEEFDRVVMPLVAERSAVIVDFNTGTSPHNGYVSSAGVGALLQAHETSVDNRKGGVFIRNPSQSVRDVLKLLGIERILREDEEPADINKLMNEWPQ